MRSIHLFVLALALGFVGVIAAATPRVNAADSAKGCCAGKAACTAKAADGTMQKGACCKEGASCCGKDKACCTGKDGAKCTMGKDGKSCCSPDMACCKDGTCCKEGGCCTMNKDKEKSGQPTASADCCYPGAACCVPGAACCASHG